MELPLFVFVEHVGLPARSRKLLSEVKSDQFGYFVAFLPVLVENLQCAGLMSIPETKSESNALDRLYRFGIAQKIESTTLTR